MLGLKFLWLLNPDDKKIQRKNVGDCQLQIWLYHPLNQSLVHKLDLKYCTDMSPLVMSPACFIISILNDAKLKSLQALRVHFLLGARNCQLTYKCRWICHEQITPLILHPNHFHFIGTMSDHCLLLSLTNSCHAYIYSNMVRALMVIQLQPLYEIVRIVMGWNGCWCLHKNYIQPFTYLNDNLLFWVFKSSAMRAVLERKPAFPSNKWQRQNPDIYI